MYENKKHMFVKKDRNGWFMFSNGRHRLQLCWNNSLGWFWLKQYAKKVWKESFMADLTEILAAMEKDGKAAFTLYELPHKWNRHSNKHDSSLANDNQ